MPHPISELVRTLSLRDLLLFEVGACAEVGIRTGHSRMAWSPSNEAQTRSELPPIYTDSHICMGQRFHKIYLNFEKTLASG
jgi:hypothetical protein